MLGVVWVSFYAISCLWSQAHGFGKDHFTLKLPILLLPLAFNFLPSFSNQQLRIYTLSVGIMLLMGALYSASFLVNHLVFYMEQYRTAKVLPTPAENDHIRFSVTVALYVVWGMYIWQRLGSNIFKWITGCITLLLVLYLHLLAAKSGLLSFYIFVATYGIYLLFAKKYKAFIAGVLIFAIIIITAWKTIPTFSQRIGYISYSYIAFSNGDRTGQYGDIDRLISYSVAVKIIAAHPWGGIGANYMLAAMKEGYSKWYPEVRDEDRLLPHNQLLDVALANGIPVAIVFIVWLFYPLVWVKRNREGFFLFAVWLILLVNTMIEPFLEVQFGVFVYLFFLLWQRHMITGRQTDKLMSTDDKLYSDIPS